MNNCKFFVEGKADQKFIEDVVKEFFDITLNPHDVDTLGSWSGYKTGGVIKASILEAHEKDTRIVLLLDADNDPEARRSQVEADFAAAGIPISLFLLPDNSRPGELEHLLCRIAVQQQIMQCFESYETCISNAFQPGIKPKVYAYLDALLSPKYKKGDSEDKIKDQNRDYRNQEHWNLSHGELTPLRLFLQALIADNHE